MPRSDVKFLNVKWREATFNERVVSSSFIVLLSLSVPSSVPREPPRVKPHSLRITPDEKLASHSGKSSSSIKQRKHASCFSVHASKTRGSNDPTINASVLTSRTVSKSTIVHTQRRERFFHYEHCSSICRTVGRRTGHSPSEPCL